jgi:hypothetical protein
VFRLSLKRAWKRLPLTSITWSLLKWLSRYYGYESSYSSIEVVYSRLTETQDANIIFAFTNFFEAFATSGPKVATSPKPQLQQKAWIILSGAHFLIATLSPKEMGSPAL